MKDNYNDLIEYNKTIGHFVDETVYDLVINQGTQVDAANLYPKNISTKINKATLARENWHPCGFLWNRLIVTKEGYLTICCIDFENQLTYSDLNKQSLSVGWNNKYIKKYRKTHKSKKFDEMPMCHNCDIIKLDSTININDEIHKILKDKQ